MPEVLKNLYQARKFRSKMSRIFIREGAARRVFGLFSKAVVQAVLIFVAETWVVTPHVGKALGWSSDPGGETDDGTAPAEDTGREVEIHLGGGGKGGGKILDDGGIYQAAAEHGCTVHCYVITVRPV